MNRSAVSFAGPIVLTLMLSRSIVAADLGPVGEPVLDPPTLHCLGGYWIVRDSDASPATVAVAVRRKGEQAWKPAHPFLRVMHGPFRDEGGAVKPSAVDLPDGATLFAGSVLFLDPDTDYEMKLNLQLADGSTTERVLSARTRAEPVAPDKMRSRHVVPGTGGGSGTAADPFKGLAAADRNAQPGDLFLLGSGKYAAVVLEHDGKPGAPIIWRGEAGAVIDAGADLAAPKGHAIEAAGRHDVWFERLEICNAYSGIAAHTSQRIVIRRCHFHHVMVGILADRNVPAPASDLFIADNLLEGMMPWPTTHAQWAALPESRGIWICGQGHVVCFNRIHHWKDGMDVDESTHTVACDFHNNDISQCFDDGCEMDGSDRNTRNFFNRYVDVLTGISFQPVHGGPCYAFRNVIYNPRGETFKLHNSPSGVLLFHNTSVKAGIPLGLETTAPVYNCFSRNNLFIGTSGRALEYEAPMERCDFDHDGFGGFTAEQFLKWNGKRLTLTEVRKDSSAAEQHAIVLDPAHVFASGLKAPDADTAVHDAATIDFRLTARGSAVDSGVSLPGLNDGFHSAAPDLGAVEAGETEPHYGPRPEQ